MKKLQKLFILGAIVALVAGLTSYLAFNINPLDILYGIGGASVAAIPIVGIPVDGTVSTKELADSGILMQDVSDEITKLSPNRFPLDTISRNIKRTIPAKSQEVKFYQKSSKPMADKLKSTASGNGLSFATPCSSYTAPTGVSDEGITKIFVAVDTPKLWRVHDTILMHGLSLQGTSEPKIGATGTVSYNVMFYVTGKQAGVLELTPIGGMKGNGANAKECVVPSFASSTILIRMGQAKNESALTTDPISLLPEETVQFCQNYITQVEETTFAAMTKKEIETGITDYERDNLESMRGEMELSQLFGQKARITDEKGENVYFTGGIVRQITKVCEYGKGNGDREMTKEMYSAMLRSVFTGNNGSAERILFAGSELIESLELLRETQKMTQGATSETYLGVIVTKVVSQFGTLRICYAPAFDEIGLASQGLIIDVAHLQKRAFLPMVAKELDLTTSGIKNAKAKTVQEVSCLTLRYPDCHALVRLKA